jgi:hypothetical protein
VISVYPFGSGSLYTASFAVSSSFATFAKNLNSAITASNAKTVLTPREGLRGKSICLLTNSQYQELLANPTTKVETCLHNGEPL